MPYLSSYLDVMLYRIEKVFFLGRFYGASVDVASASNFSSCMLSILVVVFIIVEVFFVDVLSAGLNSLHLYIVGRLI